MALHVRRTAWRRAPSASQDDKQSACQATLKNMQDAPHIIAGISEFSSKTKISGDASRAL
jgi:hypothetical protein